MNIGSMFIRLGVKADTFTVRDFSKAVADIPFAVAGAITSMAGLSIGFLELTKNTLDISNNLALFRSQTGLSIGELQKWEAVAKQVGVSGDVVASSILGINNALAQIKLGNGSALLPLGRLGVDARGKNAFQILQEIGQNRKGLDPATQMALMGQLGVNPQMMRIFSLSPGDFARKASVGPMITDRDQKALEEFQAALARFAITIEKDFVPVLMQVEPYLKDLADALGFLITKGVGGAFGIVGKDAQVFNQIRKEGFGKFMSDALDALIPADPQNALGTRTYNQTVTQNIHSTADPAEVARIAHEHLAREKTRASKQFDNTGY